MDEGSWAAGETGKRDANKTRQANTKSKTGITKKYTEDTTANCQGRLHYY
jgi:hypothetical protein